MTRVLVVEDEPDLALGLQANLALEGYDVEVARSASEARTAVAARRPDVVLLDLMLPDGDGVDLLRAFRAQGLDAPVLVLTARDDELDKVRGFRAGADDYVTKPFALLELLLRVQALARRVSGRRGAVRGIEQFGDVEVDLAARSVRRGGRDVPLTPKAYDLLTALLSRRGHVVPRWELLKTVWQYDDGVTSRTIDTHVAELRRKLERDPASPQHIITVYKIGYRLDR